MALVGAALIADARLADSAPRVEERRRRARAERDRQGEGWIGAGWIALGAALAGRDRWAWSNVAVLLGVACFAYGAWRNRTYLREVLTFRGAARRGRSAEQSRAPTAERREPKSP